MVRIVNWLLGRKSVGVDSIASERYRQIEEEGFTESGDDKHRNGELVCAAVSYAMPALANAYWPFPWKRFRTSSRIRNLEKAGALIAAEIDRLKRLETQYGKLGEHSETLL